MAHGTVSEQRARGTDEAALTPLIERAPAGVPAFAALYELAVACGGALDAPSMARLAVAHARNLMGAESAALYLWDAEAGLLTSLADNSPEGPAENPNLRANEGAAGQAFARGQAVAVEDYPAWEHSVPCMVARGVKSAAAAPLLVEGRAVGALVVRASAAHRFDPRDVDALALLAIQISPALDVARLYLESERRRAEAEALAELARQGAIEPDTDRAVSLVTETASRLLGADYAGVALTEANGSRSWRGAWGNRSEGWLTGARLLGRGLVTRCLAEGHTVVAEHLGENPEFPLANLPLHEEEGGRTALTTPLVSREGALGALVLGWRWDFRPTARHVRLAEALAGYAATVIDNARAHARLAARAEELTSLYQAVACGVLVRNAGGQIIHANAAAEEIFGLGLEQMRGRTSASLWQAIHEDGTEVPGAERPGARALRERQPIRGFTEGVIRPDGALRWLQVDSVPVLDASGKPRRVVSSFIDITARKQAEEEVKKLNAELERRVTERTSELEAANKELEAFSYSVSHDLRAPLRSIDGFSQALLEEYGPALEGEGRDYLNRVRSAAQRMAELIDDVLTLARVARHAIHREVVDLSALADAVARDLQSTQPERDVTWEIEQGLHATGDVRLLQVVLENLLGNAWKFTSKRPTTTIAFGSSRADPQAVYFVRDNGAGFDMAYADKLFTPFQRLHTLAEFEGTGVGLATVQRIIHRHGGRVWAEGAPEQGATISFSL